MGNTKDMKQMLVELTSPKRNNYYYGKMMDVRHFDMEQQYGNHKRWLNNRLTLGEGVLCGLEVEVEEDGKHLSISTGAAIDTLGREIIVHVRTRIDPWLLTDKCRDAASELSRMENHVVHICLVYNECLTDHEPVLVAGCGSQEECAPGTVIETFKIIVKEGLPDKPAGIYPKCCDVLKGPTVSTDSPGGVTPGPLRANSPVPVGGTPIVTAVSMAGRRELVVTIAGGHDKRQALCERLSKPCSPCPGDACVVLAAVELGFDTISQTHKIIGIDQCSYRKKIYSNQVLMDLILCLADRLDECCKQEPVPEPEPETLRVKSIELLNDDDKILATVRQFPPNLVFNEPPPRIRVTFTKKVDPNTIKTFESGSSGNEEVSFLVAYAVWVSETEAQIFAVPGKIGVVSDTADTILWEVDPSWKRDEKHTFTISLVGDEGGPIFPNIGKFIPIRSDSGELLDGDPPVNSLPSGNGVEGGILDFFLTVVGYE